MKTDPGFYQISNLLETFRRMTQKCADLLQTWKAWFRSYQGSFIPGPFSQMMQCLQMLGWSIIEPPLLRDHEGFAWNLLLLDKKTLRIKLEDAWLQYIATQVNHKTMDDLVGLDGYLTKLDLDSMTALDRARLSALHSGAFISNSEHARFDADKNATCELCHCVDDRFHWLQCPRFRHHREAIPNWLQDNVELPRCTVHHLLVPRQQALVRWRQLLCQPRTDQNVFQHSPPESGMVHLFLDGSCFSHTHPALNLAAWAIVNASACQLVASSPLDGITQTIDRAELTALVKSLDWSSGSDVDLALWSDSQSTVQVADYILNNGHIPLGVENLDLWTQVQSHLADRGHLTTWFRWVPAHLCPEDGEDGFEDWVIKWNDLADQAAKRANNMRPPEVWEQHAQLGRLLDDWACRIRQLRSFYFAVASEALEPPRPLIADVVDVITDSEEDRFWLPWEDTLPVAWPTLCQDTTKVPGEFLQRLVLWICAAERLGDQVRHVSDIELTFALIADADFCFPFRLTGSTGFQLRKLDSLFQKPTFTTMLRPVQFAMAQLCESFPQVVMRMPPQPHPSLGIHMKVRGTCLKLPTQLWGNVQTSVSAFTAKRPVRRSSDLARPLA
eukprot:Skav229335  [mRNA]  locus=scaffold2596:64523:66364:+ [translate_table: standard]